MLAGIPQAAASPDWRLVCRWAYFDLNFYSSVFSFQGLQSGDVRLGVRIRVYSRAGVLRFMTLLPPPPHPQAPTVGPLTPGPRQRATWWMLPDLQLRRSCSSWVGVGEKCV